MQFLHVQQSKSIKNSSGRLPALAGKMMSSLVRALGRQKSAEESRLSVAERISLGPKKNLFLVRCDGQQFLVATGADMVASPVEVPSRPLRRRTAMGEEE